MLQRILLLLVVCAAIVGGVIFYTSNNEPAPAPIVDTAPDPVELPPAPEPEPIPEPTPEPPEEVTVAPAPVPQIDPLEWIQQNWKGRLREVTVTQDHTVDVYDNGSVVGEAILPAGRNIQVVNLSAEQVTVQFMGRPLEIAILATDLQERAQILLEAAQRAAATAAQQAPRIPSQTTETSPTQPLQTNTLDAIIFGDSNSESSHAFHSNDSKIITGGLDQTARMIKASDRWKGGKMKFTLKVAPNNPNYLTVKFWGNDIVHNRLMVFIDNQQLGYFHLGDYDVLDIGAVTAIYPDRFYYTTIIIPKNFTRGKDTLEMEIRAQGGIWAYGAEFDEYQHPMEASSRGIYAAYTHTDSYFTPSTNEAQGRAPDAKKRNKPGRDVIDKVKERVNRRVDSIFSRSAASQNELRFLAYCYHVKWTEAYKNRDAINSLLRCGDKVYQEYLKDKDFVTHKDGSVGNQGWKGLGSLGEAIWLMHKEINDKVWSEKIHENKTRREAWSEMLVYSRDWNMGNRRKYTNQCMIKDLYGIYLANKGLRYVDSSAALNENDALEFLYESMGIKPWLGPIGKDGRPTKPAGDNYYLLTQKALTKELGYVGAYGEVQDWAALIYEATRPYPGQPGDPHLLKQLAKINRARSFFRYPAIDDAGYRAMRMEGVVGWRDFKYPGNVVYGQKPATNGSSLQTAAATQDLYSVGYAQQMIEDGQFFASVAYQLTLGGLKNDFGLLPIPDEYDTIRNLPDSPHRLPMSPGQPDFVFSDEEAGVIALKHQGEIFYASLYWRARYGINNLARIHHMTPEFARIATVWQTTEFSRSGMEYERENWTNYGFAGGGKQRYPEKWDSAHAGESLPIAQIPRGIEFRPGDEDPNAGKGDFYTLRYGPYLIGMNCTTNRSYNLKIPQDVFGKQVTNLIDGNSYKASGKIAVKPRSTIVLYIH